MMTQFFQVLKLEDDINSNSVCFMMTQFFQVLKQMLVSAPIEVGFMMTQFFQVLKLKSEDNQVTRVL